MWNMEFDGSYSSYGSREGVMLISPKGDMSTFSFKLDFPNTSNIAEYEALLLGFYEANLKAIKFLTSKGDAELIVKQVRHLYAIKND